MPQDQFVHGKRARHWLGDGTAQVPRVEITDYILDKSMAQTRAQTKATVASDRDQVYGPASMVDGSVDMSGPFTPELDRILSRAIRNEESIGYRYQPAGTGSGRVQIDCDVIVTADDDASPVTDLVSISASLQMTDTGYERTLQP